MKKIVVVLFFLIFTYAVIGCSSYDWEAEEEGLEPVDLNSVEELYHIRITAGDTVLSGVLYDTQTARDFAAMLPLTVDLWDPAPDFAKSFDLTERIPRYEKSGYEYELGSLAYWYDGPSVALIYKASREETVVPVVPMGKITSDVSFLQEYEERITIELEEGEKAEESGSEDGSTVLNARADAKNSQTLYLWEEGNAPAVTEYTQNNGGYGDDPDFRPYLVSFPVPEGTEVKGVVLICAGGAFQFRSDENEGTPVAEELAKRGYQSFVVNYRLRPYTQEEGALDLARAVRFVRKNAEVYGIDEKDIAVMGFSAGGILAGEMLLNFDGLVNGTALDGDYVPDSLDEVSADAAADGMIYSFYGRLSVGSTDVEMLRAGNLPPTFYRYGTRDPFYSQFLANADAVEAAGVQVERLQLDGRPHGFGFREDWFDAYDRFLAEVFSN